MLINYKNTVVLYGDDGWMAETHLPLETAPNIRMVITTHRLYDRLRTLVRTERFNGNFWYHGPEDYGKTIFNNITRATRKIVEEQHERALEGYSDLYYWVCHHVDTRQAA